MTDQQAPISKVRRSMKWVGRYISLPLLILIIIFAILYYAAPDVLVSMGIDVKQWVKYGTWFFVIKGSISTLLIIYGLVYLRNRGKK
ncbi:MAG: hypothetical protein RL660_581 [Bacteroidota bacterium]